MPYLKHKINKVFKNLLVFKNKFLKTGYFTFNARHRPLGIEQLLALYEYYKWSKTPIFLLYYRSKAIYKNSLLPPDWSFPYIYIYQTLFHRTIFILHHKEKTNNRKFTINARTTTTTTLINTTKLQISPYSVLA